MDELAERRHELLSEAARIKSWLPSLRLQRDECERRLSDLNKLILEEREALTALMDEADLGSKHCSGCGDPKQLHEFPRNHLGKDGHGGCCKECLKAKRARKMAEKQEAALSA